MSKNEWHGSPTRGWRCRECRKTEKRSCLYEDEGSKFSSKKKAYGRNYSMQQNGNGEWGGGQFDYGREKLSPYGDGNELYGNSRHFSEGRCNYMNQSGNFFLNGYVHGNFDLNQNVHFESREKNYNNMGNGKFEIVGDDSRSEEESSDSGIWSHQGNADQTHTFDRGWNRYRGQGRPWNPGGRGFRSTKRWRNGHSTGHREKSILQMSSKEKINKFCIFLRNDVPKVNAIQTIENGLASSRLGLKSEYHVQEYKTVGGKPHFTGVLKLSGVFMGRSFGTNKKETKHGAYDTALDNLIHKSVDEIFQLLDPGIEAIRDEEDVSAELETNHNAQKCHLHISDANSVQTGNNNTQMINIPPGQEKQVNVYQSGYGGSQQVTVNINLKEERRSSDSERGTEEEFYLRIQASRQDGRSAVDLEKIGVKALGTEEGLQLIIKPMERVLGAKTVSISEGSIIIRLRPNNEDSISKLKAAIKNEELHIILGKMIELEKVKSACSGCQVILDITACIPVEDFDGKNKSFTKQGSILMQFRPKLQDSNSRLKTAVETGDLQRILTRFAELKQVRSALRGSDLVLNVTASLPKAKETPSVSQIHSCKDQNLGELPENNGSNIPSNSLSERLIGLRSTSCRLSDTMYKNRLKSACLRLNLNRIETQPNTQLLSAYKSSWMFHPTSFDDQDESDLVIPAEVLKMNTRSCQLYKDALRHGMEKVYNIRVMVVGAYGVGKTTLTKRLLGEDVHIPEMMSTDGKDVHIHCCKVSLATGEWITPIKDADKYSRLQRLVRLLNEHVKKKEAKHEQEGQSDIDEHDNGHPADTGMPKTIIQLVQKIKPSFVKVAKSHCVEHVDPNLSSVAIQLSETESIEHEKMGAVMEILQLLSEKAANGKNIMVEYAALAMMNFGDQFVFYTTHQTFLARHALYLLVADLSQQVKKDNQHFLGMEGIKLCKVHDMVEMWLNSIHFCAPDPEAGIPPVILVGTHVDKIPEKSRQQVIDCHFNKIRLILKEKLTRHHLMAYTAIDNTQFDPGLEALKRKILELASKQSYWGEQKPVRWLPLEQAIMKLKAFGVKVVPLSLLEEINRSGSVRIESRDELDLFLRFQHELGTILYYSVEELREKVVLERQWMIDALKSLINAGWIRENLAITSKWYDFKEKGILTPELVDAIWTKEKHEEFHDNKEHILHLMEQLNIIAKPRSYSEDGKEVKMEDYFLAPCMIHQATPREVITPEPHQQLLSSSVLSYVFIEKFLPPPIFHRLVAACLAHWPVAKKGLENMIFCGCCVFKIDPCHKLTLHLKDYVIFARATKISMNNKTPDSEVCIQVKEFIDNSLSKIIGCLKFEWYIQCPLSETDCLDSLLAVSSLLESEELSCTAHDIHHVVVSKDLLKFWFSDKLLLVPCHSHQPMTMTGSCTL